MPEAQPQQPIHEGLSAETASQMVASQDAAGEYASTDFDFLDPAKIAAVCTDLQDKYKVPGEMGALRTAAWRAGSEVGSTAQATLQERNDKRRAAYEAASNQDGSYRRPWHELQSEQMAVPYGHDGTVFVSAKGDILVARVAEIQEPTDKPGVHDRILIKTAVVVSPDAEGRGSQSEN